MRRNRWIVFSEIQLSHCCCSSLILERKLKMETFNLGTRGGSMAKHHCASLTAWVWFGDPCEGGRRAHNHALCPHECPGAHTHTYTWYNSNNTSFIVSTGVDAQVYHHIVLSLIDKVVFLKSWGCSSVAACLPNTHKAPGFCPAVHKPSIASWRLLSWPQEMEGGGTKFQGILCCVVSVANLDCMTPCLKNK